MPSELEIIEGIKSHITDFGDLWTIGVTDNCEKKRLEQGSPKHWFTWDAGTETAARYVEKHFLGKGLKSTPGGAFHPTCVYIFRH